MCAPSEVFSYAPQREIERERERVEAGWYGENTHVLGLVVAL